MRHIGLTLALAGLLTLNVVAAATPPTPVELASYAETLLAEAYRADAPGVAVLVMRGDKVLYRGARGAADVAGQVPLEPGDRFRIGSVTKQLAAAGLLTLVDEGKVSLDDPLSKYLPAYPGGAAITIEQLLNHTSGIKSYTEMRGVMEGPIQRDLTTAQMIDYFKNQAPDFVPGERWGYSNSGYVLVGAVIEVASGQAWYQYLEQALFTPIGMNNTGYGADPEVIASQVNGYTTRGNVPHPAQPISMTQPHAAGALVSTVDDLGRWSRALHEGRVLQPAPYARMVTPVGAAKEVGYGFGIETSAVRGVPSLQHSGGIPGFTAHLIYVPGPDVTVAMLHNDETPSPAQETRSLARRIAAVALGDPYPPVVPVVVDAAVLEQYEGVYRIDVDATRKLRVVDGKLTAQRAGPLEVLTAIADDTFLYSDGFTRLQVLRDATRKVIAMRFWADGEGEGDVAVLTDQALPLFLARPIDWLKYVGRAYALPALAIITMIAMFGLMRTWRRHKRPD